MIVLDEDLNSLDVALCMSNDSASTPEVHGRGLRKVGYIELVPIFT